MMIYELFAIIIARLASLPQFGVVSDYVVAVANLRIGD